MDGIAMLKMLDIQQRLIGILLADAREGNDEQRIKILNNIESKVLNDTTPVLDLDSLKFLQQLTEKVYIDESIKKYIAQIILATRFPSNYISSNLAEYVNLGSSPRGTIAFMQCSKALALINGRTHVIPEDIKELSYSILRHRISLNFAAMADGITVEQIIDEIMKAVPTP